MIYCELCENAIEGVPASISVTCCGKCYRIEESPVERMAKSHASEKAVLQAEIDRLTAQNLQLRLICDRAVVFLLAGSVPDQTLMDDKQLGDLNEYMDSVDYNDLEECKSTEHGFHSMLIGPLLNAGKEDPDKVNLLKLAMAEQNRCKLVTEEVQQLEEIKKLKPECGPQIEMATWAFRFAHEAGGVTSKAELVNLYSPAVNLARSAAK